ncbi:hypothetical protein MTO96_010417 [Rhipicephalus appendiculatus]
MKASEEKEAQVSAKADRRSRPKLDRSWGKAVIACAATFFSSAVHSTSGIFYVAFMHEFDVNRETASWPTSVFQAMDNVSGIILVVLQKYFAVSSIGLIGSVLFWSGIIASHFAPDIAWMTVTFGFIQGLGSGVVCVAITVVLMTYFDKYRGVATGIRYAGYSLSSLLYPMLLARLEHSFPFRQTVLLFGGISLHLTPLVLALKEPPWERQSEHAKKPTVKKAMSYSDQSELGGPWKRLGQNTQTAPTQGSRACLEDSREKMTAANQTNDADGRSMLVARAANIFTGPVEQHDTTVDQQTTKTTSVRNCGTVDPRITIFVESDLKNISLLGRTVVPLVADIGYTNRTTLACACYFLFAVTIALLALTRSYATYAPCAGVASLFMGSLTTMKHVVTADYFGVEAVPVAWSTTGVIMLPMLLCNPSILGFFRDQQGSYDNFYYSLSCLHFLMGTAFLLLRTAVEVPALRQPCLASDKEAPARAFVAGIMSRTIRSLTPQFFFSSLLFTCLLNNGCASAATQATGLPGLPTNGQGRFSTAEAATAPFQVTTTVSALLPSSLRVPREDRSHYAVTIAKQEEHTGGQTFEKNRPGEALTPAIVAPSTMPLTAQESTSELEARTMSTEFTTGSTVETSLTSSPASANVSHSSRPGKSKFLEGIQAAISRLMSSAGPGLRRQLFQADISPQCSFGLFKFMSAIQTLEPWAMRLIDATAKYPTGFLQASLAEIGAYDECIETVVHDEHGVEEVRGQFCNVHVMLGDDLSFVDNVVPAFMFSHKRAANFKGYLADKKLTGLRMGVCFISSCSERDLANIGSTLFGSAANVVVKNCVTGVFEGIDTTQACIIAFLAVLAGIIVAATSFELLTRNWENKRKNSIPYKCIVAFSIMTNTRVILNVNNDKNSDANSLRFIHGIRFLSIFWICLGHSYGTIAENITRVINALHYFERWESLIVIAGFLAVDTFFFFRATIPLFFMIMCMYLLPLIASGPNSKEFYNKFYAEIHKHWWDLLLQVRNWRGDQEITTLVHVWYLSADFQFFLVGIIVIQVFKTTVTDTINDYYLLPFYHGVCFFSGCITFLLVERFGKVKISKIIQASLWCICLFCGLYCMFMKLEWYRSSERASETRRLFVAFTDRILWSVCVAWFVFTCATDRGGFVNRFLCWSPFVPLSRLSFGVYLIHSPFYILMYHIARERIFFSHFTLVSQCFAVVVWSYILSYFLFIACEGPTGHLEKLVFMPVRRSEDSRSDATKNGVHHNGFNGTAKSITACSDEQSKSNKYMNEDSLEAGIGIAENGSNECCRL